MELIGKVIINALAFYLLAYVVPGVEIGGYQAILVTALIWGIITMFVRPIIKLLTFPINFVTLGLFSFIINAALLLLTANIVENFSIDSFSTAIISAILLAIINSFLNALVRD